MMIPLWTAGPSVLSFFLLMTLVLQLQNVSKLGEYWMQLPSLCIISFT